MHFAGTYTSRSEFFIFCEVGPTGRPRFVKTTLVQVHIGRVPVRFYPLRFYQAATTLYTEYRE